MKRILISSITALSLMTTIIASADGAHKNPLLEPSKAPFGAVPFDKITPADYEEAVLEGIKQQNKEIEAIVNNKKTPNFQNTIAALDRSGSLLTSAVLALGNVEHATGDTVMMNLMAKLTPVMSEQETSIILNQKLFNRIKKVYENRTKEKNLTPEQLRLIEETYRNFAQNGANLQGDDREQFAELNKKLSDLTLKFTQNVTNDMKSPDRTVWVTIDKLNGFPESIIAAARADAAEALKEQGKEDDGSLYMFSVNLPSYTPWLKYQSDRNLRKDLYIKYNTRGQSAEFNNEPLVREIANTRLELAKLFGKKNYAEFALQGTMAGTPENVYEMLNNLNTSYTSAMRRELKEVEDYARQQLNDSTFNLEAWDYTFWSDKLKNDRYAFNEEDMKPYFELNNTIDGVFGLATKLYGYTFKENKDIPGYHPDVRAYEVYDKDGKILGLFYCDFFNRPGKTAGAWMTEYRTETKDDKGNRTIPIISIVCNFAKPVGGDPVLLTPYEVETFLHEFGHSLHGLSSQATYASLSGTNVYHDFVELFSQFNENYMKEKEFLDSFARHYESGEAIPQELIDRFVKASQFGAAYACMRQLGFGYVDMAYHTITEPLPDNASVEAFEAVSIEPVRVFRHLPGTNFSTSFSHVFSGGYAAGYYGYKWSEELEADAFEAFKENGIFDPVTAGKFHKMLESGGTVDPMALYIEFRGKKPTPEALMRRDGIIK
ncbi:MAG: M3 family metallopeptidase [Prevotella sp.]|nr:M3 family metallopeptidase [Bacteroides sp.]MCM1365614.1 M3 family metallopeptidase [Prevotella sp.]